MGIEPWGGMNVASHWGGLDVRGKVVLDVGADYGTTAAFFLDQGAKAVVAVESNEEFVQRLLQMAEEREGLVVVRLHVVSKDDFRDLLCSYEPEVVKVDCEGCECALLELDDEWFSRPALYAIETHGPEQARRDGNPFPFRDAEALHQFFLLKFQRCGYEVVKDVAESGESRILYARRGNSEV